MSRQFVQRAALPALHRRATRSSDEPLLTPSAHQLVQLQQSIGNSGVRALLARRDGTAVQREPVIQRFWGDDEETESEGGGSSWLDSVTDTVSDWAGGGESETESGGGGGGGGAEPETGGGWSEGGSSESESETDAGGGGWSEGGTAETEGGESGGSWLDEISDWFDGEESEQEPTEAEGEKSWWDELWSDDESESGDSESGEADEGEVTDEPPREIEAVSAACNTTGHGGGTSIKLHGLTSSNYDHAAPIPAPFPSSVTVTERKVKVSKDKEEAVFDASGTFDVTFASNPSISLPTVPSGLTPCQEKAVQAFIDGPLTAHENDHKAAFENNYDGSFTATVSANNIKDTPEMRKRAMENPVMTEDQKRATAANAASKALDPWTQTVTGLDCKEPEKKPSP